MIIGWIAAFRLLLLPGRHPCVGFLSACSAVSPTAGSASGWRLCRLRTPERADISAKVRVCLVACWPKAAGFAHDRLSLPWCRPISAMVSCSIGRRLLCAVQVVSLTIRCGLVTSWLRIHARSRWCTPVVSFTCCVSDMKQLVTGVMLPASDFKTHIPDQLPHFIHNSPVSHSTHVFHIRKQANHTPIPRSKRFTFTRTFAVFNTTVSYPKFFVCQQLHHISEQRDPISKQSFHSRETTVSQTNTCVAYPGGVVSHLVTTLSDDSANVLYFKAGGSLFTTPASKFISAVSDSNTNMPYAKLSVSYLKPWDHISNSVHMSGQTYHNSIQQGQSSIHTLHISTHVSRCQNDGVMFQSIVHIQINCFTAQVSLIIFENTCFTRRHNWKHMRRSQG